MACFGLVDEAMADMDWLAVVLREEEDISDGIIHATVDFDVVLDAEEARLEALGGKAGGVHLDVADHRLELVVRGHRAEERFVREDNGKLLVPDAISANGRNFIVPNTIAGNGRNLFGDGV